MRSRLAFSLLLLAAGPWPLATARAQYASPQSAAPRGHYIRVPRATPQVAAPRDIAPPLTYEVAAPRQRIEIREVPAARAPAAWRITGYRTPFCGRHKVKLGRKLIQMGSPRPVFELVEAPEDTATVQVVAEVPQAPAEDMVYVPDEEPVFAQRAIAPPKAPPIPSPKLAPRAVAPRKVAPRAVPSPQGGEEAPPPPKVDPEEEPAPGDDG